MRKKHKNARTIAEGLAKGLTQMKAVEEAGYAPSTAQKKAYAIVKRPLVQSALTEAIERQGVTFDDILQPYFDGLKAMIVMKDSKTLTARATTIPAIPTRMDAADRLVELYGGKPRVMDLPAETPKGLLVIIQREGGPQEAKTINVPDRTKIEPQGEGKPSPLPVRITRGGIHAGTTKS